MDARSLDLPTWYALDSEPFQDYLLTISGLSTQELALCLIRLCPVISCLDVHDRSVIRQFSSLEIH